MTIKRELIDAASQCVTRLIGVFDRAVRLTAERCAVGGVLDGKRVDAAQVVCFDLAWSNADLLAAQAALDAQKGTESGVLDRRLALTFAVDAIISAAAKLEGIMLELGEDAAELQAVVSSAELGTLRRAVLSGAELHTTGRMVADHGGEIGHVEIGEELSLVQDQFRRFASDVVAPLAEKIHRHDLTVPDALLTPLKEMGVFGLSIPEKFGGTAPDDRDDNLMMIVVTEALSEASLAAAGSLITRPEILSRALLAGGTEEQKQRWLPQIAQGEPLCAIAITEPDFGSDVASLSLKGTKTSRGVGEFGLVAQ